MTSYGFESKARTDARDLGARKLDGLVAMFSSSWFTSVL